MVGLNHPPPACVDNDGDGYGNPASISCTHPELDCDDDPVTGPNVNPGEEEFCLDGLDNNCNGDIDEECSITNSIGMAFKLIPSGTFMMGSPDGTDGKNGTVDEPGRSPGETLHPVTLTQDFYMQTTEVTQAQWEAVMGSRPSGIGSHSYGKGDNFPVYYVSWNDIQDFIKKLKGLGMGTYRLPTESEWEYSCRAGSTTAFANGDITSISGNDSNLNQMGWYGDNSETTTHAVAQKTANAWGLYDMHGNVDEWCSDWWLMDLGRSAVTDPTGQSSGSSRVIRGGSWYSYAGNCRSASRAGSAPRYRGFNFGFRLVRTP